MDSEVLTHHWDDRGRFRADYLYLNEFYERVLPGLANKLNNIHDVNHQVRYWRILVGPWIAYFLQMLYDRWMSVESALREYQITESIDISGDDSDYVPNDMGHLVGLMIGDEWNHYIYARILKEKGVPLKHRKPLFPKKSSHQTQSRLSIRNRVASTCSAILSLGVGNRDACLLDTYLPFLDEVKLSLRLGQTPQLSRPVRPVRASVKWEQRQWGRIIIGQTQFEEFFLNMLSQQIPTLYLEGYPLLLEQIAGMPWPKNPKAIYSCNALLHETVAMGYIAEKTENGSPFIYGQHGGFYGAGQFIWAEEHERKVADKYLTWGWDEVAAKNIVPIGINKKIIKRNKFSKRTFDNLLLVLGPDGPRYTFRLDSDSGVCRIRKSIADGIQFGRLLKESQSYDSLVVRLFPTDYGFGTREQWTNAHPSVKLEQGARSIWRLVSEAKLVVYTYNSTGYLEFMAANVPVVIFWDLTLGPLRASSIPDFDELEAVGVFHSTPESAAVHVKKIWNDIEGWWISEAVQNALTKFKNKYCYQSENIVEKLEKVLKL
jgi:putative transferase (TIGR04331 family)